MNDLQELGSVFYRARLQKNLSLEELEQQTKIRLRFLHAIEEGNFEEAPGEVYLRGFLRSFARAVDLDPEQILIQYDLLSGRDEKSAKQNVEHPLPTKAEPAKTRLTVRERRARHRRRQRVFAVLVLLAAVILASVYHFRSSMEFL